MKKTIISCAVTGSIHTPSMSPHLPVTAEQIAESAIGAAEAGAAILHLHARVPDTGAPSQEPAHYAAFLSRLRTATDAIVNITTGGGLGMSMDARIAPALKYAPELASLNMGSFNFNISAAEKGCHDPQPWEVDYLRGTRDLIMSNTFSQIETVLTRLSAQGTRFEFECYDTGHLYNLAHFADRGLVKPPFFVQAIFGVTGAQGTDPENLMHMRATAQRLFGSDHLLSVLGAGRSQFPLVTMGAILGGHVRVGLEDNLYIARGQLAESNARMVAKVRRILEELGHEIATPDEARRMLGTKGAGEVAF
ncbi:3-keto-5-aminohexanoate cleavage protein [Rhodobacter sphaeroides]|jgi:3-keto-5-aminohexanoate cleavage enzyme|uniref:3-keto-5-aminohexanoate cleavage enzyme n=1 Tax=Cereibacter sphaeroides (strain ATCC 17023 / DSM 158 / JCM 6121 / CCUG 31486 / LMG 2827 / NBRC 12203 / NCIMB 8253 / ATH 2.4.1.) TaxID=272943 RepID=Q3IXV4_CERS4|nr:3-keto-5-aminohexanoate cleavage protein [Cereibacter sphaeroides]ABA80630.1 3-keto-5-aminohexanoate cleavage enzyme [Cereibacter sphaeroides 2.4.1]AMJ48960.1 3-keto-5-aminohexanoate cleavage protein [Cereibacter sphaeroides]ANS35676.1 3-keto-5-aminohexanoate cleavage protein [Cereibacter sphaeroides]ATN64729.1 3-keto-5-aminohexanoate cleavage protein [Cereibacter sphaeroides]AXC62923.1 3-keto-5-aminohexanoate cleavage protein [Cereibacter sphaeroides 2.4.1]